MSKGVVVFLYGWIFDAVIYMTPEYSLANNALRIRL
jgi:hypothetical protein